MGTEKTGVLQLEITDYFQDSEEVENRDHRMSIKNSGNT